MMKQTWLTGKELISELKHTYNIDVTPRQLRSWREKGFIPYEVRKSPKGIGNTSYYPREAIEKIKVIQNMLEGSSPTELLWKSDQIAGPRRRLDSYLAMSVADAQFADEVPALLYEADSSGISDTNYEELVIEELEALQRTVEQKIEAIIAKRKPMKDMEKQKLSDAKLGRRIKRELRREMSKGKRRLLNKIRSLHRL